MNYKKKLTFNDAVRRRIKRLYKYKRYTMNEFAKKAGIPYSTINSYINSTTSSLTLSTLDKICVGLNMTVPEFFDNELFDDVIHE
jgi:transcriptional regulator with XRE-family HTH domain